MKHAWLNRILVIMLPIFLIGIGGCASLPKAAENGDLDQVKHLLRTRADSNAKFKALCAAALRGYDDIVRELVKAGADVNRQDENGVTALWCAAYSGHTYTATVLLTVGANPNIRTVDGGTILMAAALSGYANTVEKLIQAGANVNAKDNKGRTALWMAKKEGHNDVVQILKTLVPNSN